MVRNISSKKIITLKKGRGIDGNRLSMCDMILELPKEDKNSSKENMDELIGKLSKIKIINPMRGAKAKSEIKNKYISL